MTNDRIDCELAGGGSHDGIRFSFNTGRDVIAVAVFTREPEGVRGSFGVRRHGTDDPDLQELIIDAACDLAIHLCEQRPHGT